MNEEHKERHKLLHKMFDELFADYILHHPERRGFLNIPIKDLLEWAHQQTINPTEPKEQK